MTDDDPADEGDRYAQTDFKVDAWTWGLLLEDVRESYPGVDGYLGVATQDVMEEWLDEDPLADAEDRLRDALDVLEDSSPDVDGVDRVTDADTLNNPTVRVQVQVEADVLASFRERVDSLDRIRYKGTALAQAIQERLSNSRADRLDETTRRLVDALEEADPDALQTDEADETADTDEADDATDEADTEDDDRLTTRADKVQEIASRLEGRSWPTRHLDEQIHDVAARDGENASEPTVRTYRDLVLDELGYVRNPIADSDVWGPPEDMAGLLPEGVPLVCRRKVDRLDRGERLRRIQLEVARRAAENPSGVRATRLSHVHEEVLNEAVTRETAAEYLEAATSDMPGFDLAEVQGEAAIQVELERLGTAGSQRPRELFDEAIDYRDALKDEADAEDTTLGDYTDTDRPSIEDRVAAADTREAAATDGGADEDLDPADEDGDVDDEFSFLDEAETVRPGEDPLDEAENDLAPHRGGSGSE